jgi:diguanylate cyclase (GGDEF)-like protein
LGVDNAASGKAIHFSDLTSLTLVANELGMALENARTFEEIQNRASYDGLTGVYNRAYIESLLQQSFEEAETGSLTLSIAMVDVDFFKNFNDNFGHLAGDSILKLIAGSLLKFSRPTEVVGRYGGEEFLCVLKDTDLTGARLYGERIRKKIEELGNLLINRFPGHPLTVSIGAATYDAGLASEKALIDLADKALYSAKDGGRNRVVVAE